MNCHLEDPKMSQDSFKMARDRRLLKAEVTASHEISRKLQNLLWKRMPKFQPNGIEFAISYILLLRAERSLASIRALVRAHMVDDAMALVRVMVEKTINAQSIFLAGTGTALDYIQYDAFRRWRDYEELLAIAPELAPKYSAKVQAEIKEAHEKARIIIMPDGSTASRFGRGHDWTELGLSKRALFVDESFDLKFRKRGSRAARILFQTAYKKSAGYLHGNWVSVVRSLESGGSDSPVDKNGMTELSLGIRIKDSSPEVASNAMNIANLTGMSILMFLARVYRQKYLLSWASEFVPRYKGELRTAAAPIQ